MKTKSLGTTGPQPLKNGLVHKTAIAANNKNHLKTSVDIFTFSTDTVSYEQVDPYHDFLSGLSQDRIIWINIIGVHDVVLLESVSAHFHLHPLALEDIMNTNQRPKMEVSQDYTYFVVKMHRYIPEKDLTDNEQVSLVLGPKYVISFQERPGDVFDHIRERLKVDSSRVRSGGADFLLYSLLDAIVDNYYIVLDKVAERMELLEEELLESPTTETLQRIHHMRRELIFLHKAVWPLREIISLMQFDETPLLTKATMLYIRDLSDHALQVMDNIETFRELTASLVDIYLSSVSNKLNVIMKFLTIFSTIFIPLTFIVGIYGMNFKYMPELEWRYGYLLVWIVIIFAVTGMLYYFRKKEWI